MKVLPFAQSSTSISVTWSYDAGDEVPESVTIREFGPDGTQMESQDGLSPLTGLALFTGLKASTSYGYQWCGVFPSTGGDLTSCADPVLGTTRPAASTGGGGRPPENPSAPRSGGVVNLRAQARPFGKVAITWERARAESDVTVIQTDLSIWPVEIVLPSSSKSAAGRGPFAVGHNYEFRANSTSNIGESDQVFYADVTALVYPGWLGLKEFLPVGFDPSVGIKRLLPDDHPFVSVRAVMETS